MGCGVPDGMGRITGGVREERIVEAQAGEVREG